MINSCDLIVSYKATCLLYIVDVIGSHNLIASYTYSHGTLLVFAEHVPSAAFLDRIFGEPSASRRVRTVDAGIITTLTRNTGSHLFLNMDLVSALTIGLFIPTWCINDELKFSLPMSSYITNKLVTRTLNR